MNPLLEKQFAFMGLKPNMKVLDAGCGSGAVTRLIARRVFPGEVVGLDIDPMFIEEAKRHAESESIDNIRFEIGNIEDLNYDDSYFDLSYCRFVLMHLNDPLKAVSELKRVTKKGGSVAAAEPDDGSVVFFPTLPKFEDLKSKYREYGTVIGMNRFMGRELFATFFKAGLKSIDVHSLTLSFTQRYPDILKMAIHGGPLLLKTTKEGMISHGFITSEDFEEVYKEVNVWLKHPESFFMGTMVFAIGKVTHS